MARSVTHMVEMDIEHMNSRLDLIEAQLDSPNAHLSDLINNNVTILSISVPSASWAANVTTSINAMKNCLISHGLMAGPV